MTSSTFRICHFGRAVNSHDFTGAMAESLRLSREETRSSQATLIEVEPSPVDETPAEYGEDGSYFPNDGENEKDETPGTPYLSRSGTLVGLGHHGPAFYCKVASSTNARVRNLIASQ